MFHVLSKPLFSLFSLYFSLYSEIGSSFGMVLGTQDLSKFSKHLKQFYLVAQLFLLRLANHPGFPGLSKLNISLQMATEGKHGDLGRFGYIKKHIFLIIVGSILREALFLVEMHQADISEYHLQRNNSRNEVWASQR